MIKYGCIVEGCGALGTHCGMCKYHWMKQMDETDLTIEKLIDEMHGEDIRFLKSKYGRK